MCRELKYLIKKYYKNKGFEESIKYILCSSLQPYLEPNKPLEKAIALASFTKKEKNIVKYLNYLEDKKNTIVSTYISNNNTNVIKMSKRQEKYMKAEVKKISKSRLKYLKSFIGVLELEQDNLTSRRAKSKLAKINHIYFAVIPNYTINFNNIINQMNLNGIKVSEQDIIAFLSLVINSTTTISHNLPIRNSYWESIFGRRNIKKAKELFQESGILVKTSSAIPGFKSTCYDLDIVSGETNTLETKKIYRYITSIKTLEKLSRIKVYKSNFNIDNKIKALEIIMKIRLKQKINKSFNLTEIFLESANLQPLIKDMYRISEIIYVDHLYSEALPLGVHLTSYFNKVNKNGYQRYIPLYNHKY